MIGLLTAALLAAPADPILAPSGWIDGPIAAEILLLEWEAMRYDKVAHGSCPCERDEVPPIDRWAIGRHDPIAGQWSTILEVSMVVAAPLATFADPADAGRDRTWSAGIAIESAVAASAMTSFLKATVHRPRPYAIGAGSEAGDAYHSFPSGHTSAAFAAATSFVTIWHLRHPGNRATKWIALGGFATAAAVGYLRVDAGRHYPTDVLGGAVVGMVTGWAIPELHVIHRVRLGVAPGGVSLSGRF